MKSKTIELINRLPEKYQPVYGYEHLSLTTSRDCSDRLVQLSCIYEELSRLEARPLKILDLGSAQGYFCFHLASLGAEVLGVDYCKENIDLCNAIAKEHSELNVSFKLSSIESFLNCIKDNEYDLVFGLSVLHHVIHEHGESYVKSMILSLSKKVKACVFEFAQKTEPPYWNSSQPADSRELVSEIAFVHEINKFKTHVSDVVRPMYFVSNQYWFVDGVLRGIKKTSTNSHVNDGGVYKGLRKYYFSDGILLKYFDISDEKLGSINLMDLEREKLFLESHSSGYPELISFGQNDSVAWLVRSLLEGDVLSDALEEGKNIDFDKVIKSTLYELISLEKEGLYHTDLRVWNVILLADSNVKLIDYGAISTEKVDCLWPNQIFFSFFLFLKEVLDSSVSKNIFTRSFFFDYSKLSEPYNHVIHSFLRSDVEDWSFSKFLNLLIQQPCGVSIEPGEALYLKTGVELTEKQNLELLKISHDLDVILDNDTPAELQIKEMKNYVFQLKNSVMLRGLIEAPKFK